MVTMSKIIAAGSLLAATVAVTPASAAKFLVNYTSGGTAASLVLTTDDTVDANGFSEVLAVSGTLGTATDVALVGKVPFTAPDNLFKASGEYVTAGGITFSAGGTTYNLLRTIGPRGGLSQCIGNACSARITDFSVNAVAAVPEASTWVMMITGFGLVGAAARRRQRGARLVNA